MGQTNLRLLFILLAIVGGTVGKPKPPPSASSVPPGAPWAQYVGKSAYARSLGPPMMPGIGTITVPYMPKATLFPKFVDPQMMIAKKTDMLSNMFAGGPGVGLPNPALYGPPTSLTPGFYGSGPSGVKLNPMVPDGEGENSIPILYTSGSGSQIAEGEAFGVKDDVLESVRSLTAEDSEAPVKRGLFGGPMGAKGPFGGPMGAKGPFGGPMGPKGPFGSPMGPFPGSAGPMFGSSPFSENAEIGASPYSKRGLLGPVGPGGPFGFGGPVAPGGPFGFGGPYGFGGPFGPGGPFAASLPPFSPPFASVADPATLMSKKADFLDTLFKTLATSTSAPPPYPGLTSIAEEPEIVEELTNETIVPLEELSPIADPTSKNASTDDAAVPKELLTGLFDPTMFAAKKTMFLDALFKNLATSTPAAPVDALDASLATTSTIVPPGFWSPFNVPGAAADEGSPLAPGKAARALDDPGMIIAAKDQIVDSIVAELTGLKDDMTATMNDLIAFQKTATPSPMGMGMKPFKPLPPWMPKPVVADPTLPYTQRMAVLSQVFDALTELQRNVSANVRESLKSDVGSPSSGDATTFYGAAPPPAMENTSFNLTLLDAIKAKLDDLSTSTPSVMTGGKTKVKRALPVGPTSFWVAYPGESSKRQIEDGPKNKMESDTKVGRDLKFGYPYQGMQPMPMESMPMPEHLSKDTNNREGFAKSGDWRDYVQRGQHKHHHHDRH